MENIELLKNIFMFKGLTAMELIPFSKILKSEKAPKGEVIIKEGEIGTQMYIIKSGSVNVYVEDSRTERRRLLAILGRGDQFGEIALFTESPRSATVEAREVSEFLLINKEDMNRILEKDDKVALKIFKNMVISLADRLKKTNAIALI